MISFEIWKVISEAVFTAENTRRRVPRREETNCAQTPLTFFSEVKKTRRLILLQLIRQYFKFSMLNKYAN